MKVSKVTICEMDAANFTIKMEGIMRVLGRIIKWTAMENFTMKVANLLIKATGWKTNSMV
jgi:hypothetical protein